MHLPYILLLFLVLYAPVSTNAASFVDLANQTLTVGPWRLSDIELAPCFASGACGNPTTWDFEVVSLNGIPTLTVSIAPSPINVVIGGVGGEFTMTATLLGPYQPGLLNVFPTPNEPGGNVLGPGEIVVNGVDYSQQTLNPPPRTDFVQLQRHLTLDVTMITQSGPFAIGEAFQFGVTPIPEPASVLLLAAGLMMVGAFRNARSA